MLEFYAKKNYNVTNLGKIKKSWIYFICERALNVGNANNTNSTNFVDKYLRKAMLIIS